MFHKPMCFISPAHPGFLPTDGIWTVEDTDALPIQHRYKLAKLAVALVPLCCSTQPNYCAATLSCLSLKERDPADISCG